MCVGTLYRSSKTQELLWDNYQLVGGIVGGYLFRLVLVQLLPIALILFWNRRSTDITRRSRVKSE